MPQDVLDATGAPATDENAFYRDPATGKPLVKRPAKKAPADVGSTEPTAALRREVERLRARGFSARQIIKGLVGSGRVKGEEEARALLDGWDDARK